VFFNNKGGVGKTTLTFNIAHLLAGRGVRVVVLDFDPQCNISAIFLDELRLFEIWEDARSNGTVTGCLEPVRRGKGDVLPPRLERIADGLWLLPGHLALSRFEQTLAEEFAKTLATDNDRALDVTTSLDLLSNLAAEQVAADIMIMDLGPSLGALNRAALLACDHVVLPVAPDLFSLQGLRNVGPTLRESRRTGALSVSEVLPVSPRRHCLPMISCRSATWFSSIWPGPIGPSRAMPAGRRTSPPSIADTFWTKRLVKPLFPSSRTSIVLP
jgi:cellulose biosynthesis protein BcsQ